VPALNEEMPWTHEREGQPLGNMPAAGGRETRS
jgi:hypothetical protein